MTSYDLGDIVLPDTKLDVINQDFGRFTKSISKTLHIDPERAKESINSYINELNQKLITDMTLESQHIQAIKLQLVALDEAYTEAREETRLSEQRKIQQGKATIDFVNDIRKGTDQKTAATHRASIPEKLPPPTLNRCLVEEVQGGAMSCPVRPLTRTRNWKRIRNRLRS